MKSRVLGIQQVNYVSKKTGNPVMGVTLYCASKDQEVVGERTDNVFISDNLDLRGVLDQVRPGDVVDIVYNRRGYVADVTLVPAADGVKK